MASLFNSASGSCGALRKLISQERMTNGRLGTGAYKMTPDIFSNSRGRKGPKTTISTSKGTNQNTLSHY